MNIKNMYKRNSFALLLISVLTLACVEIQTINIEVTSEDDSGVGTLRQAIMDANFNDFIYFASNVQLIKLLTPLPSLLSSNVTISGIGSVINGEPVIGDCNALPSPVCDPDGFSSSLPVTIDGSLIPLTEQDSGIGLRIVGSSTVIGLKIQNFTGSANFPNAIGIIAGTGTATVTISCCVVSNILSGPTQVQIGSDGIITSGDAIGIHNAASTERCLVRNIKTPPILAPEIGTEPVLATGNAIGINNFTSVDECNVTQICGGDIFANNNQSDYTLLLGQTVGFRSNIENSDPQLLTNSTASYITGGSVSTNYLDSIILPINDTSLLEDNLQYNTCGASINNSEGTITIENSAFCTIQAGNITSCGHNTTITTPFAAGIYTQIPSNTITSNTVIHVTGSNVCLSEAHSTALFPSAAGIVTNSALSISTSISNTISHITAGCSRIDGECSHIFPQHLFTYPNHDIDYYLPSAVGLFHFDNSESLVETEHISNITGGTHIAHGLYSSISSAGSVGIASIRSNISLLFGATIKKITGPKLTASHAALIARNLQASAGIQQISEVALPDNNTIEWVCEASIQTSGTTPTINGLPFSQQSSDSTTILPIFTSGIYIDSLPFEITISIKPFILCSNNSTSNIVGSKTLSNGSAQGSIATGIFFRRPSTTNPPVVECGDNKIGLFEGNSISTITGGTNAPAYGILLNQDLYLQDLKAFSSSDVLSNTISHVKGETLLPYNLTQEEFNAECLLKSEGKKAALITIIPPFPYGPSSGINLFASGCAFVQNNAIKKISSSDNNARGIGTVASSDVEISGNTITAITGPGIFVGGASADPTLIAQAGFTTQEFEDTFPSIRNKIFDNSTSADMTQGIELGTVNWNNFFASLTNEDPGNETIVIVGNHNQVYANIFNVRINSNGTTTIDITFSDKNHPNSTFIIQFFRNSSNTIPHGEQAISPFTTDFSFTTNLDGTARARFVFVPAHKINKGDIVSAHVTLTVDGTIGTAGSETSPDIGDTSGFAIQESDKKQAKLGCFTSYNTLSKERTNNLNNFLFSKNKQGK